MDIHEAVEGLEKDRRRWFEESPFVEVTSHSFMEEGRLG